MTLRDIFCNNCGAAAVSVNATFTAEQLDGTQCYCIECDKPGTIRTHDDGEVCGVEFVVDKPVPYTVGDLFGELERQVKEERERQVDTFWYIGGTGVSTNVPESAFHMAQWCRSTSNSLHAKRLAGWPSGEWQGMKEVSNG